MSWNYSGDPENSPKDYVRFLIGDTDREEPLLDDQEIQTFLNLYNQGILNASIRCCEAIAAKFSRRVNESVGQVKMDFKQAAEGYRAMAMDLRRRLAIEGVIPYAGGISVADKIAVSQNSDRVKPDFSKHMQENTQIAPLTNNEPNQFSINNQTEDQ